MDNQILDNNLQGASRGKDYLLRGLIAALGAPADMGNLALNTGKAIAGYGGRATGLMSSDQMPVAADNPMLGSEWLGQQAQNAGLVSQYRNPLAEALTSFVNPGSAALSAAKLAGMLKGGALVGAVKAKSLAQEAKTVLDPGSTAPTLKSLREAFERAIANHTSLPPEEQLANSKAAAAIVAKHMGGPDKPLLNENTKLMKASKGYELDGQNALKLDTGEGVETTGLALAPALRIGKFNTCPNAESCKGVCLGKTAGNYFQLGGGTDMDALAGPRMASFNRTKALVNDPEAFAVRLYDELIGKQAAAAANGNRLGARLNVLSDIHPKVYQPLMEALPEIGFYDYTKNINASPVAANHHLTYSSTGVSQPASITGLTEDITNPHTNWTAVRGKLDEGGNVAMAFSNKRHMPESVFDQETGKTYRVINGDLHDFRPIDEKGVIVGLKNKAGTTSHANAVKDSGGFLVHYDPQIPMVGGKQARDEAGNLIIGNTQVTIAPQQRKTFFMDNDGNRAHIDPTGAIEELK